MSLLNGFNGQQGGRPAARPQAEQPHGSVAQPAWGQQPQAPQHGPQHTTQGGAASHQWGQPAAAGYAPQSYVQQPHAPQAPVGQGYGGLSAHPESYAPNFEPYSAPVTAAPQRAQQQAYHPQAAAQLAHQPQGNQPHGYGQQAHAGQHTAGQHTVGQHTMQQPSQQWAQPAANPRGFDANSYLPQTGAASYRSAEQHPHEAEPSLSDWQQGPGHQGVGHPGQHQQYQNQQGYDYADPHGAQSDLGFAQPAGGELEQGYADDDGQEYELEEPQSRIRRPMMIAAALAGAIFIGGGLAYGYKSFLGGPSSGQPPVVKSATAPSKTKPADAGGKQFAHTDSKIMGRLGDGAPAAGAAAATDADANGTRKVSTLVVGRDGSIQAPAAAPAVEQAVAAATSPPTPVAPPPAVGGTAVSVPGMMVVDALGPKANAAPAAAAPQKLVVTPPAAPVAPKPVVVAKAAATGLPDATGSIDAAAAAVKKPAPVAKKVAAAANDAFSAAGTAAAPAATVAAPAAASVTGGNGFVAVLASVPRSASSRMEALKRYADMQQKYGSVLGGKTPDVAEANLGAKGAYHRLVVGPPGSREQAGTLCSQLKAQGYADCWVTSY